MPERFFHSLIVGSGDQGFEWAKTHSGTLCLDADTALMKPHVYGDIFKLPFPTEVFSTVYSDFVFNSFVDPAYMPKDPHTPNFAEQRELSILFGGGLVRPLRFPELLKETLRVMRGGGNLVITDLASNITIVNNLVGKFQDVVDVQQGMPTETDFQRSISLNQITKMGYRARQIIIQKA